MKIFKNRINKLLLGSLVVFGFNDALLGYDALLTPTSGIENTMHISYESNDKDKLFVEVNSVLNQINIDERVKFTTKSTDDLKTISSDHQLVADLIAVAKYTLTINGLMKNVSKELSKEVLDEFYKIVLATTKSTLDSMGIQFQESGLNALAKIIVDVIVESGKKTLSKSDIVGKVLDGVDITNNIVGAVRINKNLFYSLSATIANAYTRYYVDYLIKSTYFDNDIVRDNKLKYFTLNEFLKNHYIFRDNIVDRDEFVKLVSEDETVDRHDFLDSIAFEPLPSYSLYSSIFKADNVVNLNDYKTTEDALKDSPKILVGGLVDLYTEVYTKQFGFPTLIGYIQSMIDHRLYLLGMQEPLLVLHIYGDNYETDSTGGTKLTTSYQHKVSDLSSYIIYPIGQRTNSYNLGTQTVCQDFAAYKRVRKKGINNIFNERTLRDKCDIGGITFLFNINNKQYMLLDAFFPQKRYVDISSNNNIYKNLTKLHENNILYRDGKNLKPSYIIRQHDFNVMFNHIFELMYKKTSKFPQDLTWINFDTDDDIVTYKNILEQINYFLKAFYGEVYTNNTQYLYPRHSSPMKLKMIITRHRLALKEDYLKDLSRAGIIQFDIKDIPEKLDTNINLKDLSSYISRLIDFINKVEANK